MYNAWTIPIHGMKEMQKIFLFTWNIAENGEADINEKVPSQTSFNKDTDWRQDDCKNDFENVTTSNRHLWSWIKISYNSHLNIIFREDYHLKCNHALI